MTTLTATQLRNARKRRAKKKNHEPSSTGNNNNNNFTGNSSETKQQPTPIQTVQPQRNHSITTPTSKQQYPSHHQENEEGEDAVVKGSVGKKRQRSQDDQFNHPMKRNHPYSLVDPSQKYSSNPLHAPIVQRAQQFFHDIFQKHSQTNSGCSTVATETSTDVVNHHHCDMIHPSDVTTTMNTNSSEYSTKFPIYIGSIYGWRTVVKLPVRYSNRTRNKNHTNHNNNNSNNNNKKSKSNNPASTPLITIGLFAPGSHHIVPIVVNGGGGGGGTNGNDMCLCQTHHPIINQAIIHIQRVARSLQHQCMNGSSLSTTTTFTPDGTGLTAFSEETGQGYLRHIALSIQRHTNLIQLVLVWNSLPPPSSDRCNDTINDYTDTNNNLAHDKERTQETVLQQFLEALLLIPTTSNADGEVHLLQWHSIWVHYNNSWKHANAIFTHDGVWKLLYHHHHHRTATKMNVDSISSSIINDKWNHNCPIGGITEYLTTIVEYDTDKGDNGESNNVDTRSIASQDTIHYKLPHVPLHFPPQVFRQGNITAFTKIVQSIRNFIIEQFYAAVKSKIVTNSKHRPSCLELYGGVGTIGLHIVDLCSKFVCSDENPHNVQCFNATVQTVMESMKAKNGYYPTYDGQNSNDANELSLPSIRYESASASVMVLERMEHLNDIDIIIVDPPRKGMDIDVCHALTTIVPLKKTKKKNPVSVMPFSDQQQQMLIYVSCGFDAFVRDYQILTQSTPATIPPNQSRTKVKPTSTFNNSAKMNPWNIIHAEGHVLFPGSDAIETLAIFTRTKYPSPE